MAKGNQAQNLSPDIVQLIEQLEHHWVAPDDSMVSKSTYYDLLKQEEMSTERLRYSEAMTTYAESIAMVEEYQQSMSVGDADLRGLYPLFALKVSPQRLVVAKAAQKLRLPLIFKDGEINKENIEKMGSLSRNSFDSTSTSASFALSSNSMSCSNGLVGLINNVYTSGVVDPGVCGVPNAFLGITPSYLWRTQFQQISSVEQILGMLIMLVRDFNLQLQHQYDELRKTWQLAVQNMCNNECEVEATRLHEYQGVDQDSVKELESTQWTIH